MEDDVYLDKIRLGGVIIEKDLLVNSQFHQLISELRQGIIDEERLNIWPLYNWCWQNLLEHYTTLKHNFLTKVSKDLITEMDGIAKKYRDRKKLGLIELERAFDIVEKIMTASKMYDIIRRAEKSQGLDKIKDRYKLNK